MLEQVRIASPCGARWDEMRGDERVRFCLACEKNVYNLSAMPRDEAERLLEERAGASICVRFYKRADGTILTEDCPVGVTKKRRKKVALAVAGAGAMALAATTAFTRSMGAVQGEAMYTMGAIAIAPPPTDPSNNRWRMGDRDGTSEDRQPDAPNTASPEPHPQRPAIIGKMLPRRAQSLDERMGSVTASGGSARARGRADSR